MALDLCLEAAGGLLHAFDAVWLDRRFPGIAAIRSSGSFETESGTTGSVALLTVADCAVARSVDRLPIAEARAVWLIDVCGLTYTEAASDMGLGRDEVAATISAGRRRIRNDLARLPGSV